METESQNRAPRIEMVEPLNLQNYAILNEEEQKNSDNLRNLKERENDTAKSMNRITKNKPLSAERNYLTIIMKNERNKGEICCWIYLSVYEIKADKEMITSKNVLAVNNK